MGDAAPDSSSIVAPAQSPTGRRPAEYALERRISYFMAFRLGLLLIFTLVAGYLSLGGRPSSFSDETSSHYESLTWASLAFGFVLTLVFARALPRVRDLGAFASLQTGIDIVLSAVIVQLTGGAESGFVFLYLVSILGAALMGGRAHVWAAGGACGLIFIVMSALQLFGWVLPSSPSGLEASREFSELVLPVTRGAFALATITLLAAQISAQLKHSVEELSDLRALYEYIVRSMSSGLVTLDREGRIVQANPRARELVPALAELPRGASLADELAEFRAYLREPEAIDRFEVSLARGANPGRFVCSLSPLSDRLDRRVGWVLHFQDVTELRELEATLARQEKMAVVGRMAASVAHEVRNPLAAMSGCAELIDAERLDEEDQRLLKIISRETRRLDRLVSDLLHYARPTLPERFPNDLVAIINETLESFATDPKVAGVTLERDLIAHATVLADPDSLSRGLWNILRNACEASNFSGTVRVALEEEGEAYVISIRDEGAGMDAETVAKIFEPLYSERPEGFGFGLAQVDRMIRLHDGSVTVDSAPGQGSTFRLSFPKLSGRDLEHHSRQPEPPA